MRVVLVSPAYPPTPGGVSDHTSKLARALSEHDGVRGEEGLDLTVVTRAAGRSEQTTGHSVLYCDGDWTGRRMSSVARVIHEQNPDVAIVQYEPHLYGPHGLAQSAVRLVTSLRARGISVVISAHELYYGRHEGLKYQPYGIAQRLLLVPLFAASTRVVVTLADRLTRMQHAFPFWESKFSMIPIGSNFDAHTPRNLSEKMAWLREHSIPDASLYLLFLGLAHPSKELGALTRALDLMLD